MSEKVVNAYLQDDSRIVVVGRGEGGALTKRHVAAEWVAYYRRVDLSADLLHDLRTTRYVRSVREEGEWIRVGYADRYSRRLMVHDERSPLNKAGVVAYEGDVLPVQRWAADEAVEVQSPRRVFLDIESDSRVRFADAVEGGSRVLSIGLRDDGDLRVGRVLAEDGDEAEREILRWFWSALDPYDQVSAWNGDWFDFPVLVARSKILRVPFNARRILFIDQMEVFKRNNMHAAESGEEKRSFALDNIASAVLGRGKLECPDWARTVVGDRSMGAATWDLWAAGGRHRELLVEYMLRDVDVLPEIERKRPYLALVDAVAKACSIFPDTRSLKPTRQMDGFMLKLGKQRNFHFATRPEFTEEDEAGPPPEKFKGAFVMKPTLHGIGKGIHVYDFKSLYPTVMITWNISPETKVAGAAKEGPVAPGTCRTPNGVTFSNVADGILIAALKELLRLRDHYKKLKATFPPGTPEWNNANQLSTAYKVIANGFYGVLGNRYSRFFDAEMAEAVTQSAAWLNKSTIAAAESCGWKAVYGDSVTADRVVVAKDPSGRVQLLPIGQLWERARHVGRDRDKELGELPGWTALARGGGKDGWFPLRRVIRHRAGKELWRISTKHGQTRVTEDHGIVCGGVPTRPEDFENDRASFDVVGAPRETPRNEVDLYDYVSDVGYETPGGRTHATFVPVGEWIVFETPYSPAVRIRRFYRRGTEEWRALLRLVGAYVSDGSSSVCGQGAVRSLLSFCKADLPLQEQVARDLATISPELRIFGPYWTETVYVVRSGTLAMALFFRAICGAGSKNKRMPDFVFELDEDGYSVLKESLWNGDGATDPSGAFIFTTTSQQLASGVSYLLSQWGEPHGWSFRESKEAWTLRTRKGKERRSRYSIKVERSDGGDDWVYDLTVDGAHTFVDGIGRVLLHNTDSAYIRGATEAQMSDFRKWANAELYPRLLRECGCKENLISIAYEKEYARLVFSRARDGRPAGKSYTGAYTHYEGKRATADSEPEIKGLAYVRGDATRLAARLQGEVIDLLVGGLKIASCGVVPTDDLARYHAVVERHRRAILEGSLPLEDVEKSQTLDRPLKEYATRTRADGVTSRPAHVEVAEILKSRGREVREGVRISYVVVDGSKSPMRVIPAEDYTGVEADRFYLWENLVYPPTKALLEGAFPPVDERGRPILEHDWDRFLRVRPRIDKPVLPGQTGFSFAAPARSLVETNDTRSSLPPSSGRLLRVSSRSEDGLVEFESLLVRSPGSEEIEVRVDGEWSAAFRVDFDAVVGSPRFAAILREVDGWLAA